MFILAMSTEVALIGMVGNFREKFGKMIAEEQLKRMALRAHGPVN